MAGLAAVNPGNRYRQDAFHFDNERKISSLSLCVTAKLIVILYCFDEQGLVFPVLSIFRKKIPIDSVGMQDFFSFFEKLL
jgi:hypothetical protein